LPAQTQTPGDLLIRPRDISFAHELPRQRWWLNGDPIATTFFNALSASFPQGERFFMDAVRPYRDTVEPELREQIRAFTTQEAVHSREHRIFNNTLAAQGYNLDRIDAYLKRRFDFGRKLPRLNWLGATIALEHFTAILAHAILSDPAYLAGAPPELRRFWQWHAIEEIEHKGVAFDTYLAATARFTPFRRWWMRCMSMVLTSMMFFQFIAYGMRELFRQDGINTFQSWRALFRYLWREPGLMRRVMRAYFAYFKPGFHPWRIDDRALIAKTENSLRTLAAAA